MVSNTENDFLKVAKDYLKSIENRKKFRQQDIETRRVEVFKEFIKKDKFLFGEINIELLIKFENFLLSKRNLSKRTVLNCMITLRTVFNLAITNSMADAKLYPFGKGKYPIKFPETQKIGFNMAEITALESVEGLTKAQEYALSAWLLSFYFAGIRVSEVLQLKWKDFMDNREWIKTVNWYH